MLVPPSGDTIIGSDRVALIGNQVVTLPGDTAISKGDTITGFIFEQELLEFRNGAPCVGSFQGFGNVEEYIRLSLLYTGADCLGDHSGTLILDKQ